MFDRHSLQVHPGDILAFQIMANNPDSNLFVRAVAPTGEAQLRVRWLKDELSSSNWAGAPVMVQNPQNLLLLARKPQLPLRTLAKLYPELLASATLPEAYALAAVLNTLRG